MLLNQIKKTPKITKLVTLVPFQPASSKSASKNKSNIINFTIRKRVSGPIFDVLLFMCGLFLSTANFLLVKSGA